MGTKFLKRKFEVSGKHLLLFGLAVLFAFFLMWAELDKLNRLREACMEERSALESKLAEHEDEPYVWEREYRPYSIEVDGKNFGDVQHRYAVVHWRGVWDKDLLLIHAWEIWREFSKDIVRTNPDAEFKRINIRFPYEGSQYNTIALQVMTNGASPLIPSWPPEYATWGEPFSGIDTSSVHEIGDEEFERIGRR